MRGDSLPCAPRTWAARRIGLRGEHDREVAAGGAGGEQVEHSRRPVSVLLPRIHEDGVERQQLVPQVPTEPMIEPRGALPDGHLATTGGEPMVAAHEDEDTI